MINIELFPNKTAIGTFSPFDQIIRLNGFTQEDIRERLSGELIARWKKSFSLFRTMYHEYTHFLDMTTTTYGLSLLTAIFNGATSFTNKKNSALDQNASAARAAIAELQRDEMHAHVLSEFREKWGYRPWYANARSFEEDAEHILTGMVFLNPDSKVEFARAPFSIPSLLESNAVANELFFCHVYGESKFPTATDRKNLEDTLLSETLSFLYDERFCLYSVCFHRCATAINTPDVAVTSQICALICEICLNVAPVTLASIAPPAKTLSHLPDTLRRQIIEEIKSGSRPLLFYMLTSFLSDLTSEIDNLVKLREELEQRAGLNNFASDSATAKSGLFKILERKKNSNPEFSNLLAIIRKNLLVQKKVPFYNFYLYELPPVLLADNSKLDLNAFFNTGRIASSFDPLTHANWMANYQKWL